MSRGENIRAVKRNFKLKQKINGANDRANYDVIFSGMVQRLALSQSRLN